MPKITPDVYVLLNQESDGLLRLKGPKSLKRRLNGTEGPYLDHVAHMIDSYREPVGIGLNMVPEPWRNQWVAAPPFMFLVCVIGLRANCTGFVVLTRTSIKAPSRTSLCVFFRGRPAPNEIARIRLDHLDTVLRE